MQNHSRLVLHLFLCVCYNKAVIKVKNNLGGE